MAITSQYRLRERARQQQKAQRNGFLERHMNPLLEIVAHLQRAEADLARREQDPILRERAQTWRRARLYSVFAFPAMLALVFLFDFAFGGAEVSSLLAGPFWALFSPATAAPPAMRLVADALLVLLVLGITLAVKFVTNATQDADALRVADSEEADQHFRSRLVTKRAGRGAYLICLGVAFWGFWRFVDEKGDIQETLKQLAAPAAHEEVIDVDRLVKGGQPTPQAAGLVGAPPGIAKRMSPLSAAFAVVYLLLFAGHATLLFVPAPTWGTGGDEELEGYTKCFRSVRQMSAAEARAIPRLVNFVANAPEEIRPDLVSSMPNSLITRVNSHYGRTVFAVNEAHVPPTAPGGQGPQEPTQGPQGPKPEGPAGGPTAQGNGNTPPAETASQTGEVPDEGNGDGDPLERHLG